MLSTDFSLQARQRTTQTFDTVTDIMTDLVNDECVVTDGSIYTPFVLFPGLVWCIQSIPVKMKGGSAVTK